MKKFVVALSILCMISVLSFAKENNDREFIIKVGFQPQSTLLDSNTNLSGSCGFEYSQYLFNIFALGAGATYDFYRNFEYNSSSGNISFLPIYFCAKLRTPLQGLGNNYFFLSEKLGYSACMANSTLWKSITGGLYYGVGIGISIDAFVIESIYSVSSLTYKTNSKTCYASFSAITIYVGFKFE